MRARKNADPSEAIDAARQAAADEAEYQAALATYYVRHPTFASIVKSLRKNFPTLGQQQLMQAARRAEDKRPKPTPEPA